MTQFAIIGAGMGGLSSAISLAARGHEVTVYEAGPRSGGKVGIATHDGVEFDTGPSLLTLPDLIDEVLALAGTSLEAELELLRHDVAFRYLWPDGTALDVHFAPEDTRESVRKTLGDKAARQFDDFLGYARRIWEAAAPNFVLGPAPSFGSVVKLGLGSLGKMMAIDPMNTMARGIESRVKDPKLRDLLFRYATYNGSNPFEAPATLNCIAWVELGLGGWGIRGGMYELARAMERVARRVGVEFALDSYVTSIAVEGGRVSGVEWGSPRGTQGTQETGSEEETDPVNAVPSVANPAFARADAIVVNADVAHLIDDLLPEATKHDLEPPETPSMSGWTAVLKAKRRSAAERQPHTVLFPDHYDDEFTDIFDHDRPPREPTVYLCAQEKAHAREGWENHEPIFVMANAPAEPEHGPRSEQVWANLRETVLSRLHRMNLIDADDVIVWERTPSDLASQFRGTRGSIYGAASNSKLAAFRRAPNRIDDVPGLYLASGSVHPGGGVPLCVQSGKTAAQAAHDDVTNG
ncbi:phytoene desaturase [Persicimonas caeni]|uniref:Phytoene desaturase n=1 Tax=Persicimonas caeni TaxID=2292766 RepID=A0A4Y6PSX2_PERCE|nr:phytoene desaturase family protein [Persicimonas caeni]QDG51229.1 phytoene desaturase [Persicimonas caeni]QED32450.1 phytoene desaturase [Persicimonas caeni]